MDKRTIGFAVLYRWRLHAGKEKQFQSAWRHITQLICAERGGMGSRLHQVDDGTWAAYAQWPDRETWTAMQELESVDAKASEQMRDAIAESFEPFLLESFDDLLL